MSRTILAGHTASGSPTSTANTTEYWQIGGYIAAPTTTEANREIKVQSAGILSSFTINIESSATSGNTTHRTRKNGANGGQTITVAGAGTGQFVDTSGSDTLAAGDRFCHQSVGSATGTWTYDGIGAHFAATTNSISIISAGSSGFSTASTTSFTTCSGRSGLNATESQSKVRQRKTGTFKNLGIYITAARGTATTFKSRKNGVDGGLTMSITGTGWVEDTTHSDSVVATDDWNVAITTGTGTDTITWQVMKVEWESTAGDGQCIAADSGTGHSITDNSTKCVPISGEIISSTTANEVRSKLNVQDAFVMSQLTINVTANDVSSASTLTLRKNGADVTNVCSITGNTPGIYNDNTHTDTLAAGDDIDYTLAVPSVSGSHSVTFRWIAIWSNLVSTTPVNQTWTHKYKIIGRIAQTYTHKYKIRKQVNQTYTHKYKIRKLVAQTFTHKYKIRKLITQTFTHKYKIIGRVARIFTHKYNIRSLVNQTYTHKYNIKKLISQTYTHKYKIRKLVSQTFTHIYDILASLTTVNRTFTHKYNLRKLVNQSYTHKYKIRQLSIQTYNVTAEDVLTPNGKWRVRYHGNRPDNGSDVGRVGVRVPASPTNSFARVFYEYPYVDTYTGGSTSASLVTTEHAYYEDFDLTMWVRTVDQRKSTPNAWESVWIMFRFNTAEGLYFHHYYLALKVDGTLEFAKKDNSTQQEHQYYFSTGVTYSYSLNGWNKVRIRGIGNHFTIWVDDVQKIDMSDDGTHSDWQDPGNPFPAASSFMYSGMVGLYNEDAEVEFGPLTITDVTNNLAAEVYDDFVVKFTHQYNIRKLVSQQYTHKYKIRKLITRTFTHKYNIRQLINNVFTHKYNIRQLISQTYTHKYKLRQLIFRTFTHKYRIWKLVTNTFTHKYNIIQHVSRTLTHKYNIRKLVSQTYTQKYKIVGRIARVFTQKYNILILVNQSFTQKYNIRQLVAKTFTHKYKIIQHVSRIFTHQYNILETGITVVNRIFTHKYNIIQHVSQTYSHKYNIAKSVNQIFTQKYNIRQLISKTLTHKYRIRQLVNNSFIHSYKIRQLVSNTFTQKYKIIQHVSRMFTHKYNVKQLASITFTQKYNIRQIVGQTYTHKYNIKKLISQTFTHSYNIRKLVSRIFTHKYNILVQLFSVSQTFTHKYNIIQAISQTFTHKYNIAQLISKTFTHKYKIKALVDVTNADTSQIITQWLKDSWVENPYSTVEHYLIPPKSKITFGKRFDLTAGSHSDCHIHVRSIDENPQFVNTDYTIQDNEDIVNIYVEVRYIPSTPDFTSDSPSPPSRMMWHIRSYIDELIRSNPEQLTNMGVDVITHVQQIPDANTFPDIHGQSAIEQLYTIVFTVKVYYALRVGRVA